jgi:hypothetical protein
MAGQWWWARGSSAGVCLFSAAVAVLLACMQQNMTG